MNGKWQCAIALKVLATLVTERYRGCRHPEAWAQMWQGGQEVMADCPSLTTLFLPYEITIIIIIIIIANIIVTVIFIFIGVEQIFEILAEFTSISVLNRRQTLQLLL